jgi:ABC-2 type transport system ATP-binding protein
MRADLAAALLHDPKILYLDEPTIGLDISVKNRVRAFVNQQIAERGTTVMLTTHDLGDIEDICRCIVIIDQGQVIYDGQLQAIKDAFARDRSIHFQLAHPLTDPGAVFAHLEGVEPLPSDKPELLGLRFDRFAVSAADVLAGVMAEADIVDFHIDEPAIEDVIRKVYAGQLDLQATRGV